MRKLLKTLAVVALGIFATSCATDLADNGIVAGQSVKVSFTPDLQMTREVGNAENVNKLFVNVYSADGQTHYPNASKVVENYDPAGQAVDLELVTGMTYMISFWAQKDDLHTVNGSTTEVSINFTEGNDDNRDAFFAVETISVNGPDSKHIKLYRPFAQLNFGASDLQNALNAGFELTGVTVATKTYTKFNLLTGEVDGPQDIEFTAPARMDGNVPTNSGTYDWLAMNYILLKEDQNFDTKLTIGNRNGNDIVIEQPNVPFRRNWRTNVVGKLLTSTTGFIVEVLPGFDGEIVCDYNNVSGASVMADAIAKVNLEQPVSATLNLTNDVEWETGSGHGSTPLIEASNSNTKELIINGNGYTFKATGAGVGAIAAQNGGKLIFNDVNFVDETVSYAEGSWEFTYLEFDGNVEFNNCTFDKGVQFESGNYICNNCSFNSPENDVYACWVCGTNATFNNCTFKGTRGLKAHEEYGSEIENLIVDGCTFGPIEKKPGIALGTLNAATTVTITNSKFLSCQAGDQNLYMYETDTDVSTFSFSESNNVIGTYVTDGLARNSANNELEVSSENGLEYLNKNWASVIKNRDVISLKADIDFTGKVWNTVDSHVDWNNFVAGINGNGYTISNMNINGGAMFRRFAGLSDDNVTISNITFDNVTVNGAGSINCSVLTLQTYVNTTLDNVDVKNSSITGNYKVAPLIGSVYNESTSAITATIKNCDVENCVVTSLTYDFYTAGLVSFVYVGDNDKVEFENCTVKDVQLRANQNGYNYHAAVYCDSNGDLHDTAPGVTVTNVTFTAL